MTKIEKTNLFNQYKNLAYKISNYYSYMAKDYSEDLEQIALLELWECIGRFDDEKSKFITYATHCIRYKVKQGVIERNGIIRDNSRSFNTALYIMQNSDMTADEIYEKIKNLKWFDLDKASFYNIYNNYSNTISIDSTTENDDGECTGIDVVDDTVNIEKDIEDKYFVPQCLDSICSYITNKFKNQRDVDIYMMWLESCIHDDKITLEEIGEQFGITKQRAAQIIKKINKSVRIFMKVQNFC